MSQRMGQYFIPLLDPRAGNIPWRKEWQLTAVFLPGECYGQRSLVDYCLQGRKELYTTEQLTHTHTHINQLLNVGFQSKFTTLNGMLFVPEMVPEGALHPMLMLIPKVERIRLHERDI